ncbi:MAG: hypothetical protein KDB14_11280, partial [Planctomycetales bacterium]|nr:hypothetical protein [Planctomycetales bacterium]
SFGLFVEPNPVTRISDGAARTAGRTVKPPRIPGFGSLFLTILIPRYSSLTLPESNGIGFNGA